MTFNSSCVYRLAVEGRPSLATWVGLPRRIGLRLFDDYSIIIRFYDCNVPLIRNLTIARPSNCYVSRFYCFTVIPFQLQSQFIDLRFPVKKIASGLNCQICFENSSPPEIKPVCKRVPGIAHKFKSYATTDYSNQPFIFCRAANGQR